MSRLSRPRAPWWQRLLLAVLSPLVFLALGEAVVRVSGVDTELARNAKFDIAVPVWLLADPDWVRVQHERMQSAKGVRAADVEWLRHFEEARYIQYKLKPNVDVQAVNPFNDIELKKGVTFRLTSNSRGFRGPEVPPKRAGRLRIVTYGDSSTFGWGVSLDETFQARLIEELRRHGRDAEVINLGMPGFSSEHGLGVQRFYATDLEPDVTIISFGANDGRFGWQTAREVLRADESTLAGVSWTLRKFEAFKLLRRLIFTAYNPFAPIAGGAEVSPPEQVVSVPMRSYQSNLALMARRERQQGSDAVFLSVCASDEHQQAMIDIGDRNHVPVVSAGPLFRDLADDLKNHELYPDDVRYYEELYGLEAMTDFWRYYVTTDGCHPNRVGHRIIAKALADVMTQEVRP